MIPVLKRIEITSSEADRKLAASLLKKFAAARSLEDGRELHGRIARAGRDGDTFLGNLLVQLYSRCGRIDEARAAFDRIHRKNIFSWNSVIGAHCQGRDLPGAEIVLRKMPQSDCYSWTILLASHADCGDLAAANRVLDEMPEINPIALTALLNANARAGHIEAAIARFECMRGRDVTTYNAMLAAYSWNQEHECMWDCVQRMPFWDLVSLNTALAALGHLESAKQFFDSMPQRDIFSWNSIIQACVEDDIADLAALVFSRMPNRSLVSWNSLIQVHIQQTQCARALELLEEAPEFDVFTCNLAIQTYTGLGEIQFAREFFDSMDQRDIVTWATMLVAHSQHGDLLQANTVYENMPQHNAVAGTAMLVAYSNTSNLPSAIHIFKKMPELDIFAWNAMLVAYATSGNISSLEKLLNKMPMLDICSWNSTLQAYGWYGYQGKAKSVFDSMPQRDLITWNSMIAGYTQAREWNLALMLFASMDQEGISPDTATYSSVFYACGEHGAVTQGRILHSLLEEAPDREILESLAISAALVSMYGKCGCLDEARQKLFGEYPGNRDRDWWNSMLTAYARNGHHREVVRLFRAMDMEGVGPDDRSHVAAIDAAASLADLELGKTIHSSLMEEIQTFNLATNETVMNTALLNLYGSCGEIVSARGIFDSMPDKDTPAWNSIISQTGTRDPKLAIHLFREMDLQGFNPDEVTFAKILDVCSTATTELSLSSLQCIIHDAPAIRNAHLSTSLVAMYARCGRLDDALALFHKMPSRDTVSWNAMLSAYSLSSATFDALLRAFAAMQLDGVPPDGVTFVTLLAACSHAGDLQRGAACFAAMAELYGVAPGAGHYACLADLLSRLGQLERAENVIHAMPYEPGPAAWTSVLGACGSHGTAERARDAARYALDAEPRGSSSYVLLSNVLGSVPG